MIRAKDPRLPQMRKTPCICEHSLVRGAFAPPRLCGKSEWRRARCRGIEIVERRAKRCMRLEDRTACARVFRQTARTVRSLPAAQRDSVEKSERSRVRPASLKDGPVLAAASNANSLIARLSTLRVEQVHHIGQNDAGSETFWRQPASSSARTRFYKRQRGSSAGRGNMM
jgi:hypothetical protein